ncbi:hypothetical protein [aff. Roholtiella sp. LEGE 12411]|uniref:hypothetical protein n=1 Tax=aff. Roholtiella sp. LEGE 12411 TaxID=1828822 RepID=UPI00187DF05A|nr:hypothetical protein [aff. Roholtiella sp. LEGE 12411]MBE9036916.1 hypothetical protein [aff. Roholtiella sp. LEGE 12411]
MRERIAAYKVPEAIAFFQNYPRDASAKFTAKGMGVFLIPGFYILECCLQCLHIVVS